MEATQPPASSSVSIYRKNQERERGKSQAITSMQNAEIVQSICESVNAKFANVILEKTDTLECTLKRDHSVKSRLHIKGSDPQLGSPIRCTLHNIKTKFDTIFPLSLGYSIYRVPQRLRSVKEEAYTPMRVSIGPFHHGDEKLNDMESDKLRYLYELLYRADAKPLEEYIEMLMVLERDARICYAERIPYTEREFVEIMLVDGCFVAELLLKYRYCELRHKWDPIFKNKWIFNAIHRDLLLLENQLPFFVLENIFNFINGDKYSFAQVTDGFISRYQPILTNSTDRHQTCCTAKPHEVFFEGTGCSQISASENNLHQINISEGGAEKTEHFVHLLLNNFTSQWLVKGNGRGQTSSTSTEVQQDGIHSFEKRFTSDAKEDNPRSIPDRKDLVFIPSATELHQVGIKFRRTNSTLTTAEKIGFDEGLLTIPTVQVDSRTESLFRNLIAFEQSHSISTIMNSEGLRGHRGESNTLLSDYLTLMDCLINTADDVKFLRGEGIIHNYLGNNNEVAQLFNNLRDGIDTYSYEFHFHELFKTVNDYYGVKWNGLKATLKREYFNTPWASISFGAGVLLLILSIIQTVCSVMPFT